MVNRLQGTHQTAGDVSVRRFNWILGLVKAPETFRVKSVAWVNDHVEVILGTGSDGDALLYIMERGSEDDGLVVTPNILIRYRGESFPERLATTIARAAEARLAGATIDHLAAMLEEDPEIGVGTLRGSPGSDEFVPGTASEVVTDLAGRRAAGGPATRAELARLLGLDTATESISVRAVAWLDNHIALEVTVDDRPVSFALKARGNEQSGLVVTDHVVLSYQAKGLPEKIAQLIARRAPGRLAQLDMGQLAALFSADPEFGKPGQPMPTTEHSRPANQLDTWGGFDAYADFFAGGEIARGQLDSVAFQKYARNIQHCDHECLFVNPHSMAQVVTLVDFPWEERVRNVAAPPLDDEPDVEVPWESDVAMVSTELTERDVIMGNPEKLRDALEFVTDQPNPENKPLFVANTCVPTVTGEDVESLVEEFRAKVSYPVLYLTVTPESMDKVLLDLLVDHRLRAEEAAGPPNPRAVNLIGFPNNRSGKEVVALLEHFGVEVNCLLLPDFETELIEGLPRAALNVFLPNALWAHLYRQLEVDTRIPGSSPPAPYGWDGTRRWVAAVIDELGLEVDFDERWTSYSEPFEQTWERLTREAAEHRLGLVVRGEEIHYLLDPSQTWGIPVLAMSQEARFGLDVFLAITDDSNKERLTARVSPLLAETRDNHLQTFDSFEEMRELLRAAPCEAVLTNHFFDWRVSEAGKNRFALQHFEMGLPGALRTIERLLEIAATPFFRRYHQYLGRTHEGLRAEPEPT